MATKKKLIKQELMLPETLSATVTNGLIIIKGPKGTIERNLYHPTTTIKLEGKKIILDATYSTKRERKLIGTYKAHIKNMFKGVLEGHTYKLKICSGHFPMNVKLSGNELIVNNFIGEKVPRKITIKPNVKVKIEGQDIIVESNSKESAGQVAADIETMTKIKNKDLRIFQDGIYITEKDGKLLK